MTERTIVTRRCDMIPPPGSSDRFFCTLESTTMISPRVVTAAPGPSLPPRVSLTLSSSTKPVPSCRSNRFSKQVCRRVWPLPTSLTASGDSRLGSPSRHATSSMSRTSWMSVCLGFTQAALSSPSVATSTGPPSNRV
jgi:hypothetical protein